MRIDGEVYAIMQMAYEKEYKKLAIELLDLLEVYGNMDEMEADSLRKVLEEED